MRLLALLALAAAATASLPQGTDPPAARPQYGKMNPWPGRFSPVAASHFTAMPFVLGNAQGERGWVGEGRGGGREERGSAKCREGGPCRAVYWGGAPFVAPPSLPPSSCIRCLGRGAYSAWGGWGRTQGRTRVLWAPPPHPPASRACPPHSSCSIFREAWPPACPTPPRLVEPDKQRALGWVVRGADSVAAQGRGGGHETKSAPTPARTPAARPGRV